ncbi:hypothetical protein [Pseudomonas sp. LB3P14]
MDSPAEYAELANGSKQQISAKIEWHFNIKDWVMSNRDILIAKIKKHKEAKEKERREKDEQKSRLETLAPQLFSKIESLLADIQEITTSRSTPILPEFSANVESFSIKVIEKTVKFEPSENQGHQGLSVTNLFDRRMFFRPLSSGDWEADDDRSGRAIYLTDTILFDRLAALVPSLMQ